jgi:peptide-methionine (S)-S-oxide reductase
VIFTHTQEQYDIAKEVTKRIQHSGKIGSKIATEIEAANGDTIKFYEAESYHQQYLDKNPDGYCNHNIYW